MSSDLLKSPAYHHSSKFSVDEVVEKKDFNDVVRMISPNNNGLNKIIWATTSSGTVPLRVLIKKECNSGDHTQINSSSASIISTNKSNCTLSATKFREINSFDQGISNSTFLSSSTPTKCNSDSAMLHRSPIIAFRRSSPCVTDQIDYSRSLEELECRQKLDLLRDFNNDPPLSSTLPSLENNILENDYLFPSSLDDRCDEYNSLSEECSRNANECEFHCDQEIRGWESETSDPSSTFNILAQIDSMPMLLNNNISSSACNSTMPSVLNSPLKKTKFSLISNTQKFELESILATASDPSKSVGSVLAEAGIGAEFHAIGRLKSIPNRLQHSRVSPSRKLSCSTLNSNGVAKTHIIVRDHSSSAAPGLSINVNDIVTGSCNNNSGVEMKSNVFTVRTQNNFSKKSNNAAFQIPCSYKGCQKVFATKSAMRKHIQIHGPRQHVCSICSRSFIERSKLKRHLLVHSGEKPYVCNFADCGKRFSLDFNLRTHIRSIHSGEKPFICTVCNKTFSQSANLRVHYTLHMRANGDPAAEPPIIGMTSSSTSIYTHNELLDLDDNQQPSPLLWQDNERNQFQASHLRDNIHANSRVLIKTHETIHDLELNNMKNNRYVVVDNDENFHNGNENGCSSRINSSVVYNNIGNNCDMLPK